MVVIDNLVSILAEERNLEAELAKLACQEKPHALHHQKDPSACEDSPEFSAPTKSIHRSIGKLQKLQAVNQIKPLYDRAIEKLVESYRSGYILF